MNKNNIDIEFIWLSSHPGNIGACARAIKNMGLKLALVNLEKLPKKHFTEQKVQKTF